MLVAPLILQVNHPNMWAFWLHNFAAKKMYVEGNRIYSRHWTFENQKVATWCQHHWCAQVMENKNQIGWAKKSKPQPKQGFPDLPTAGWCHLKNCFTTCSKLNQNPCEKTSLHMFHAVSIRKFTIPLLPNPCSHQWKITFDILCSFCWC